MPTLLIAFDFARCFAYRAGFLTARSTRFAVQAEQTKKPSSGDRKTPPEQGLSVDRGAEI
jgi:hypothetical protein